MSDAKLLELMEKLAALQANQDKLAQENAELKKAVADGAGKPKSSKDRPRAWVPIGVRVRAFAKRGSKGKVGEGHDIVGYVTFQRRYTDDGSPVMFGFTSRPLDPLYVNVDHLQSFLAQADECAAMVAKAREALNDRKAVDDAIAEAKSETKKRDKDNGLI